MTARSVVIIINNYDYCPDFQAGTSWFYGCPQYNERPQLAKVLHVGQNKLKVQWFDGSWSGKWKIYKYKVGRNVMEWVGDVHQSHLVATSGVELTWN